MSNLAEAHAQQDLSFNTEIAFTRLAVKEALKQLRKSGFSDDQLPANGIMEKILNRLGYRLRPVVKAKPKKKFQKPMPSLKTLKKRTPKTKGMARSV